MTTSNNEAEIEMSYYPSDWHLYDAPWLEDEEEIVKPTPSQEEIEDFIASIKFKDATLQYYFDEMLGEDEVSKECCKWVLDRWYELKKELTDSSKKDYDAFNKKFTVYDLI